MPLLPSYRNHSIDLLRKSTDWFLYESINGTEWVKQLLAFYIRITALLIYSKILIEICLFDKIDSKLVRRKHQITNHHLKTNVLSIFKAKLLSTSNYLKYITNLTSWCRNKDDFKIKKTDLYILIN